MDCVTAVFLAFLVGNAIGGFFGHALKHLRVYEEGRRDERAAQGKALGMTLIERRPTMDEYLRRQSEAVVAAARRDPSVGG